MFPDFYMMFHLNVSDSNDDIYAYTTYLTLVMIYVHMLHS